MSTVAEYIQEIRTLMGWTPVTPQPSMLPRWANISALDECCLHFASERGSQHTDARADAHSVLIRLRIAFGLSRWPESPTGFVAQDLGPFGGPDQARHAFERFVRQDVQHPFERLQGARQ